MIEYIIMKFRMIRINYFLQILDSPSRKSWSSVCVEWTHAQRLYFPARIQSILPSTDFGMYPFDKIWINLNFIIPSKLGDFLNS